MEKQGVLLLAGVHVHDSEEVLRSENVLHIYNTQMAALLLVHET